MNSLSIPPLVGDGQGRYRVKITGNSGAGKTTLAKALAGILDVPYISIDGLVWKPGWQATPTDEFRERLRAALDQDPRGWVIDGDFVKRLGHDESTDIIWLDPPLLLYFPRLLLRTFLRLLGIRAPCSPGCEDTVRETFLREGIVWRCLSRHWYNRRKWRERMKDLRLAVDSAGIVTGKMRRIGGWGGELKQWWNQVGDMVCTR